MESIELDFGENKEVGINFENLNSSVTTPNINISRNDNITDSVKNISSTQPNLTMNTSKEINIGLDLLANPSKLKKESSSNLHAQNLTIPNLNTSSVKTPEINVNLQEISFDNKKDLKEVTLDSTTPKDSVKVNDFNFETLPDKNSIPVFNPILTEEEKKKQYEAVQKEKFELLCLFERLAKKNIHTIRKYTMNSDIEEMRYEYNRIKKQREVESSIKFQRKMLMACVTGVEFLNTRFDPFDIQLDGWSEAVHENLNDYDEVFEELYEKYNAKTNIAPEIKLMLMVGGSAFMFHLTNTMFKSSIPGMGDIMKQNPELMQQFAKAAMNTMSGGNNTQNNMFNRPQQQRPSQPSQRPPQPSEREMRGPPDIDTILNQLSEDDNNIKNIDISNKKGSSITLNL